MGRGWAEFRGLAVDQGGISRVQGSGNGNFEGQGRRVWLWN